MRKLSKEEMELVTGGFSIGDVVVASGNSVASGNCVTVSDILNGNSIANGSANHSLNGTGILNYALN